MTHVTQTIKKNNMQLIVEKSRRALSLLERDLEIRATAFEESTLCPSIKENIMQLERDIEIRTAAFEALTLLNPSNLTLPYMECAIFETDNYLDGLKIGMLR